MIKKKNLSALERQNLEKAQEIYFSAMDAAAKNDFEAAKDLISQALAVSQYCSDALLYLADFSEDEDAHFDATYAAYIASFEALDEQHLIENIGKFWLVLETRPFMRASFAFAKALLLKGETDEAMTIMEDCFVYCPNDNLGVRYFLVNVYLTLGEYNSAKELMAKYDEGGAFFAWSKVLLYILKGELKQAEAELEIAKVANCHVFDYIRAKKPIPKGNPKNYSYGDENEAILYLQGALPIWQESRAAISWLKNQ